MAYRVEAPAGSGRRTTPPCHCLRVSNPRTEDYGPLGTRAARLFRRYHCFDPSGVVLATHDRVIPPLLVHLGWLRGLIYQSDRGSPGTSKSFVHFMKSPPRLACDPDGRQLYLVGGRYRVTRRGIEG